MKRIVTGVLCFVFLFSVFGCSRSKKDNNSLLDEDRWNHIQDDDKDDDKKDDKDDDKDDDKKDDRDDDKDNVDDDDIEYDIDIDEYDWEDDEDIGEEDSFSDRVFDPLNSLPDYDTFVFITQKVAPDKDISVSDMRTFTQSPSNYDYVCVGWYGGFGSRWDMSFYDYEEDCKSLFSEYIKLLDTDVYDEVFSGDLFYNDFGDNGYIIADVYCYRDGEFFDEDQYYYGGIFYCRERMLEVWFVSDEPFKNSEMDYIDQILTSYVLPTPRG